MKNRLQPTHNYFVISLAEPGRENLVQLLLLLHPNYVVITDASYFRAWITESIPSLRLLLSQIQKTAGLKSLIFVQQSSVMKKLMHEMKKRHVMYYESNNFSLPIALSSPVREILKREKLNEEEPVELKQRIGLNSVEERNGVIYLDASTLSDPELLSRYDSYMGTFAKQKILVLSPQERVGRKWQEQYEAWGENLAKEFDYIFLTDRSYEKSLHRGIKASKRNCQLIVLPLKKIAGVLIQVVEAGDVVLFFGHDAAFVRYALRKQLPSKNPADRL